MSGNEEGEALSKQSPSSARTGPREASIHTSRMHMWPGRKDLWGDSIANTMVFLPSTSSCVSAETTTGMHIGARAIGGLWLVARDGARHALF